MQHQFMINRQPDGSLHFLQHARNPTFSFIAKEGIIARVGGTWERGALTTRLKTTTHANPPTPGSLPTRREAQAAPATNR
jgi:hypothetical protein